MRYCTFRRRGEPPGDSRLGVVRKGRVCEIKGYTDMRLLLARGGARSAPELAQVTLSVKDVVLGAPLPRPGKILAAIVNTAGMLGGEDVHLDRPRLDMKAPSTVIGPGEEILAPAGGIRPEVELAAIVGSRISRASPASARAGIFGYTVLNDVTAPKDSREDAYEAYRRDRASGEIRRASLRGPLFRSKNHDTFCPMGPWIVTADELRNVCDLRMTTRFGGRLVQDGRSREYLFAPWEIASYVSGFLSLEPGDVVSCGSVGWAKGALGGLDPTEYVLPSATGTLVLEISGIGKLTNPVAPAAGR